jgi:hypothetical protein
MSKLWVQDQGALVGPIQAEQGKIHPNGTATFHITDEAWLSRLGWGKTAYVEVQAWPMPADRQVRKNTYAWEA